MQIKVNYYAIEVQNESIWIHKIEQEIMNKTWKVTGLILLACSSFSREQQ
jgi:hypothetical protein